MPILVLGLIMVAALSGPACSQAEAAQLFRPVSVPLVLPLNEQVLRIPMTITRAGATQEIFLEATLFLPDGPGPFPLVVLSHGTTREPALRLSQKRLRYEIQSWEFVHWGFAVVIPMRRGYGNSGGDYAEEEGLCEQALFYEAGLESAKDLLATVRFLSAKPYIDPQKIILAGHSTGGFASLAVASRGFPGLLGVINFGGGRGSMKEKNCSPPRLAEVFEKFGRATRVPTLWIYAEDDTYFPPWLAREMYRAYTAAGGRARLVMLPAFGGEGHFVFPDGRGLALWTPAVSRFLRGLGFRLPG